MLNDAEIALYPLLQDLPEAQLDQVLAPLTPRLFNPGQTIIRPGDPARGLFLVLEGEALVSSGHGQHDLDRLGPGSLFGEAAVLTGAAHRLKVVARTSMRTALLAPDDCRELLAVCPQVYRHLCQVLAAKLGRTATVEQLLEEEQQEMLLTLSRQDQRPDQERLPGRSRAVQRLNQDLARLADGEEHLLIEGEAGTGKRRLARLLHYRGRRQRAPLLTLDCNNPPPLSSHEADGLSATEQLETAQQYCLFGRPGETAATHQVRRGYLELAVGGDLLLEHIEHLAPRIQALLAHHLKQAGQPSAVRLLATSMTDLAAAAETGAFSPRLYRLLAGERLRTPPLRERKKDLPELVRDLLPPLNRKHQKQVTGLTNDAIHKLVDYTWPQNIEELRQVLDRAVALCDGDSIRAEQLFLHQQDFSSRGRFNLLELPQLRRFADSESPWRWPRLLTATALLATLVGLLAGGESAELANLALWAAWWPALLLLVAAGARSWCSICPLQGFARLLLPAGLPHLQLPKILFKAAPWLGLLGTLAVLTAEQFGTMRQHPRPTLVLLGTLLAGTLLTDLLFGRRAWCRILCPLGRLVGQCARLSLLELQSNPDVCGSQCRVHECVRQVDCPMGLHPAAAGGSDDCVLCLSCARHCPHHSVRVDLRWPWLGVLHPRRRDLSSGLFAVTLASAIPALAVFRGYPDGPTPSAVIGTFCGALLILVMAIGPGPGWQKRLAAAGIAWLPLAGAALLCHEAHHFLAAGERLPAALLQISGLSRWVPPSLVTPELGTLALIPPLGLLAALLLGWHLLDCLGRTQPFGIAQLLMLRLLLIFNTLLVLLLV